MSDRVYKKVHEPQRKTIHDIKNVFVNIRTTKNVKYVFFVRVLCMVNSIKYEILDISDFIWISGFSLEDM